MCETILSKKNVSTYASPIHKTWEFWVHEKISMSVSKHLIYEYGSRGAGTFSISASSELTGQPWATYFSSANKCRFLSGSLRNPRNLVSLREGRNESALGVFFDVIWILIQDISLQVQIRITQQSFVLALVG